MFRHGLDLGPMVVKIDANTFFFPPTVLVGKKDQLFSCVVQVVMSRIARKSARAFQRAAALPTIRPSGSRCDLAIVESLMKQ